MNNDTRTKLEYRREQLKIKMKAEIYIARYISPVQEIFNFLRQQNVAHEIVGFTQLPAEYHPYVEQAISEAPYKAYGFRSDHLQTTHLIQHIDAIFDRFPSTNQLRYVPDLPGYVNYNDVRSENSFHGGLHQVMQALALQDQSVYMHYLNYALVLKLSLTALADHEHQALFNTWHGDVMIFPIDMEWLIVFTLEEEWLGGTGDSRLETGD